MIKRIMITLMVLTLNCVNENSEFQETFTNKTESESGEITKPENENNDGEKEIMSEQTLPEPIQEYEAYFLTEENRVIGITGQSVEPIQLNCKEFFVTDTNSLFWSVDETSEQTVTVEGVETTEMVTETVMYEQVNGVVSVINTKPVEKSVNTDLPTSSNFKKSITNYAGFDYTDIQNTYVTSGIERLEEVSSYYENQNGLWFSVIKGRSDIRPAGIYFWSKDKTFVSKRSDTVLGKIYVK